MIDVNALKEYFECDDAFIADLLDQFKDEAKRCREEIKSGIHDSNLDKVKAASHRMLSSTRIFNFTGLTEVLEGMEIEAEKHNVPKVVDLAEQYDEIIGNYLEEVENTKNQLKAV